MTADLLRQIPNVITVVRVLLVIPTTWYLIEAEYLHALVLMTVAGASDAVDGWLARRFDWVTRFGAALDPMADKILVGVLFIALTLQGRLPLWVAGIAIARDVVIVGGATAYRILFKHIEFEPTLLSKANTALQIVMLLLLLLSLCGFEYLSPIAQAINDPYGYWIVSALALASGVDYVVTWGRRAVAERTAQRAAQS
ncbi:MAG TPA: CDP-alcohol phosphatidyltransferase family protein [Pseudomonadales bacterium]|nr:CDP-alcohol phosphatidyltransferase family protein [Pseudomonadales bacterium]